MLLQPHDLSNTESEGLVSPEGHRREPLTVLLHIVDNESDL